MRQEFIDILAKRTARLVLYGQEYEGSSVSQIAGRYAHMNRAPRLPDDPKLVITPKLELVEHREFKVFKRWMKPTTASEEGYEVIKGPNAKGMVLAFQPAGSCSLFSATSKMSAASFSLPAGGSLMGGTCPSANTMKIVGEVNAKEMSRQAVVIPKLANAIVERDTGPRPLAMYGEKQSINNPENICDSCYAAKGNFGTANIQVWQMIRFAWTFATVKDGTFVRQMSDALHLHLVVNAQRRVAKKQDPRFFRLHDSGDFFSPTYLLAWAEVCAKFPDVSFWAPTRVWMLWPDAIREASKIAPNLVIRPSALQFGDPAPFVEGIYAGSTAHKTKDADPLKPIILGIAKWDCPAYAFSSHSCMGALDPKNKKNAEEKAYNREARANFEAITGHGAPKDCRFCWKQTDFSVSYHAH